MSHQPLNLADQLHVARMLCAAVKGGSDPVSDDPTVASLNVIMNAVKRVMFVEIDALTDTAQRMEVTAHVCGYFGELVGMALKSLPGSVQKASMQIFADELNAAIGSTKAVVTPFDITPQPKENLH